MRCVQPYTMRLRLRALLAGLLLPLCALPGAAATLPSLVIYPFAVDGSTTPPDLGSALANQIAAEVTALGGVTVIHGDAKPDDYRRAARAAGADAYLTGAIVRVGSSYSAIEQLVRSGNGIVISSQSIHFSSLAGAAGAGQYIHDQLAQRPSPPSAAGVAEAVRASPVAVQTVPPATPKPSPAATPSAAPSTRGAFAVMPVGGPANDAERAYAAAVTVAALKKLGLPAVAIAQTVDPQSGGAALCTTTGATALIAGTLETRLVAGAAPAQIEVSVGLRGYRCQTHALDPDLGPSAFRAHDEGDAIRQAIDNAVLLLPSVHLPKKG
jgi:hypothetical protein